MFIYVSGPYSPTGGAADPNESRRQIEANVKKANEVALVILEKGHIPFVPHTMMKGWEDEYGVRREQVEKLCELWVEKCDALYFIGPSPGAEAEKQYAEKSKLLVFTSLDKIPEGSLEPSSSSIPEQAFKAYLTEYQECMESYRHTYTTIWQAGALAGAISAAIITFAGSTSVGFDPLIQVLIPLPLLFWYLGIYRPMNRYGELRSDRLAQIEKCLNKTVSRLNMQHCLKFKKSRKKESILHRLRTFKWVWKPRVVEVVTILGVSLIFLEIFLLWKNFLSNWLKGG